MKEYAKFLVKGLDVHSGIKVMHGRIPVKFEDHSFDGSGEHSDVHTKSTPCSKELPWKFMYSAHEKEERLP